ncbi:hypothetical protein OsI_05788 [Oryza sativa Indica Group]|uniref:DUF7769 domain-containing protein n=1 Tax=Oryza sativa subsp. indica TaxID=39946 RepID=A2X0Q4_ORYSI|nr:hypothetical protein OsI_05788 [Oryza sativa Indica Group]
MEKVKLMRTAWCIDGDNNLLRCQQKNVITICDVGPSVKKWRYYPDDLKIAIYLQLLAKTDPLVLQRGVTKAVALNFDLPVRAVQQVWRSGQDYGGIEGVINKLLTSCGCKRVQIDMESIRDVPLRDRTTIQDLANALGVK